MRKYTVMVLALLVSVTCYGQSGKRPYVLLISFDGFRSDYVERFDLPNFKRFIKEGAAAEAMLPSFPSKTFPNHYTIVTGLYPGHHGLVDNTFFDPEKKTTYAMKAKEAVTDPAYYGGKPLWQLAKENGVISASYFWVGSELPQEPLRPDYFYAYDQNVPFNSRIDEVVNWLSLPEEKRPHLITLYFHSPDSESHRNGPLADATKEKVIEMDQHLGTLVHRIDSLGLPVNIVLVSDHGMSEMTESEDTYVFVDDFVKNTSHIQVVNGGTQVHIYTSSQTQTDSLFNVLSAKAKDFAVIKRKNFPERWHYDHKRAGDILMVVTPGKYFTSSTRDKMREGWSQGSKFGAHGFDPDVVKDMAGIFYAKGPNIKGGVKVKPFRNIHVYPLVAAILNLKTPPIDGDLKVLKPILK